MSVYKVLLSFLSVNIIKKFKVKTNFYFAIKHLNLFFLVWVIMHPKFPVIKRSVDWTKSTMFDEIADIYLKTTSIQFSPFEGGGCKYLSIGLLYFLAAIHLWLFESETNMQHLPLFVEYVGKVEPH